MRLESPFFPEINDLYLKPEKTMKPKSQHHKAQGEFFRVELSGLVDISHPLVKCMRPAGDLPEHHC